MSSHMEIEVIGTIWFDDASSYPQEVALIEEVSELLWGANDDGTREPYSIEESIERMKEYTTKSHAWDLLVEASLGDGHKEIQLEVRADNEFAIEFYKACIRLDLTDFQFSYGKRKFHRIVKNHSFHFLFCKGS